MRLAPSAQIFRHSFQIGYILVIFFASAESPPRSSVFQCFGADLMSMRRI